MIATKFDPSSCQKDDHIIFQSCEGSLFFASVQERLRYRRTPVLSEETIQGFNSGIKEGDLLYWVVGADSNSYFIAPNLVRKKVNPNHYQEHSTCSRWRQLLSHSCVAFEEIHSGDDHPSGISDLIPAGHLLFRILSDKKSGFVNGGYGGFHSDLLFDEDGELTKFEILES